MTGEDRHHFFNEIRILLLISIEIIQFNRKLLINLMYHNIGLRGRGLNPSPPSGRIIEKNAAQATVCMGKGSVGWSRMKKVVKAMQFNKIKPIYIISLNFLD